MLSNLRPQKLIPRTSAFEGCFFQRILLDFERTQPLLAQTLKPLRLSVFSKSSAFSHKYLWPLPELDRTAIFGIRETRDEDANSDHDYFSLNLHFGCCDLLPFLIDEEEGNHLIRLQVSL